MDKKISQLSNATTLTGTEIIPIVQGGVTVKTTAEDIANSNGSTSSESGRYTPTLGLVNCTISGAPKFQFSRIGQVITVSASFEVTPIGAGDITILVSSPVSFPGWVDYDEGGGTAIYQQSGLPLINLIPGRVYCSGTNEMLIHFRDVPFVASLKQVEAIYSFIIPEPVTP